uniref:Uncharacterized protein n=1 Tax=Mycena chlorophos TaxID=658473 RepID=A0ABQ0KWJ3_MYCCL|nr:predicted protein [Mycena chlorophos]
MATVRRRICSAQVLVQALTHRARLPCLEQQTSQYSGLRYPTIGRTTLASIACRNQPVEGPPTATPQFSRRWSLGTAIGSVDGAHRLSREATYWSNTIARPSYPSSFRAFELPYASVLRPPPCHCQRSSFLATICRPTPGRVWTLRFRRKEQTRVASSPEWCCELPSPSLEAESFLLGWRTDLGQRAAALGWPPDNAWAAPVTAFRLLRVLGFAAETPRAPPSRSTLASPSSGACSGSSASTSPTGFFALASATKLTFWARGRTGVRA